MKVLQQVLAVDPEDLQAHYNLMLCYNGLGDEKMSKEYQKRYLRFKADEASQTITGPYRQLNPEDNNERQNIHEHTSVPLPISTTHVATDACAVQPGKLGRLIASPRLPGSTMSRQLRCVNKKFSCLHSSVPPCLRGGSFCR